MPYRLMTPEEFAQEFRTIEHPQEGELWPLDWTPEMEKAKEERRLWTAVDGDDGETFYLSGWHLVNRFAFVITERPYPEGDEIEVEFPPFGSCATCEGPLSPEYKSGTYCSETCAERDNPTPPAPPARGRPPHPFREFNVWDDDLDLDEWLPDATTAAIVYRIASSHGERKVYAAGYLDINGKNFEPMSIDRLNDLAWAEQHNAPPPFARPTRSRPIISDGLTGAPTTCAYCQYILAAGTEVHLDGLGSYIVCPACGSSFDYGDHAEEKARLIDRILTEADECDVRDWAAMWLNGETLSTIQQEAAKAAQEG